MAKTFEGDLIVAIIPRKFDNFSSYFEPVNKCKEEDDGNSDDNDESDDGGHVIRDLEFSDEGHGLSERNFFNLGPQECLALLLANLDMRYVDNNVFSKSSTLCFIANGHHPIHQQVVVKCSGRKENIMLRPPTNDLVLIDFNNSRLETKPVSRRMFKFPYSHPVIEWRTTRASDWYACGIVLAEMINAVCFGRVIDVDEFGKPKSTDIESLMKVREMYLNSFSSEHDVFYKKLLKLLEYLLSTKEQPVIGRIRNMLITSVSAIEMIYLQEIRKTENPFRLPKKCKSSE